MGAACFYHIIGIIRPGECDRMPQTQVRFYQDANGSAPALIASKVEGKAMKTTTDALKMLDELIGDDPQLRDSIAEEASKQHVARLIYSARADACLTQTELARRVGTSQSVIARLEDADYGGHSLSMLRRIADALGLTVVISLCPKGADQPI